MIEPTTGANLDFAIVCHAEVDLPAWLRRLTARTGWRLVSEEEAELCELYGFRNGQSEAEVVLYQTGYATVEVDGKTVYDGHLLDEPGYAKLHYYNAESGEQISVH